MNIDAVLELARLGFRVHPLQQQNKIPILGQWEKRATTNESAIRMWAAQYKGCNWGIATGEESGIIVVDIDPKNGGDETWRRLIDEHEPINTVSARTGSGGTHFYFSYPNGYEIGNSSGRLGKGIDVRGNNGQVVAPGSIHPNGTRYEWINSPFACDLYTVPNWILDLIQTESTAEFSAVGSKIEKGNRNNSIYHAALALARQGTLRDFTITTIKRWVEEQNHSDIPESEIIATIDSAYKAAAKKTIEALERSDTFNAEILIDTYGEDLIYVAGIGWHYWNGKFWEPDPDDAVVSQLFIKCMKAMRDEAIQKLSNTSARAEAKELGGIIQWAVRSMSASAISAAIKLATTFGQVRKTTDDIDPVATNMLLNCNNGTVNLRTGILRSHCKTDYITKLVRLDYDPTATCQFWESTLNLVFDGNKSLISFMQKALGYSITGLTDERCFFICWGESGANGKSTILETVQNILGRGYSQMSDMVVITSSTVDNRVSSSLAKLQGSRFVNMNEAEEHQKLSEALIKQLTGGDTVQACFKYKNPFEYVPIFKLWIRTNEKPIIRSQTNAIWDRIKLIPFERSIPKDKRLPRSEVDANLNAEQQGILTWLVRGAQLWIDERLTDTAEVTAAVQGYRTDSDIIRLFMDECMEENDTSKVKASDAYQAFVGWSRDAGERYIMTRAKFVQRCASLTGKPAGRSGGNTYIMGVKLNNQAAMYVN